MKKILIPLAILLIILIISSVNGEALATNRIFLLDTSGSMRREGLFERIKETLKRDYVSKMRQDEHIIILTFDEKVAILVDQKIEGEDDIARVNSQIDTLKANGPWTWMTQALQMTIEQAKRLKNQYPKEELIIYFLTDGINDPPPDLNEPQLKFVDVLKYFKDFKIEDAYVYVLIYEEERPHPILPREQQENIENELEGRVKIDIRSPVSPKPIPPEIRIGYSGFDFGDVNLSSGEVIKTGSIGIKELKGEAKGKVVKLSTEMEPFPQPISFKVSPDNFPIQGEGQIEKITIHIPQDLSSGEYIPTLKLSSDDVLISPNKVPVRFEVKAKYNLAWLWKPMVTILIFAILYLLLLILRTRSLWVQKEGQENRHQVKVRNMKKSKLDVVGVTNYQLGFGIYPHEIFSVFLFKGRKKERKIIIGESVKCQGPQGKDIIITFHNKPSPLKHDKSMPVAEKKEKEEDPDFFKKRDSKIIDFLFDKHKGDIK